MGDDSGNVNSREPGKADQVTEAKTAAAYTHTVYMVFCYNEGKNSCWIICNAEQMAEGKDKGKSANVIFGNGYALACFKSKVGRRKAAGQIWSVKSTDDKGTTINLNSMDYVGQWGCDADRVFWSSKNKAFALEKMAGKDSPVADMMKPLLAVYKRSSFAQRAVIVHEVLKAFAKW